MFEDRYLYHCFPRRGANQIDEIAKGLRILESIRDFGFLLMPEHIEWTQPVTNHPARTFPVVQSRVCFTDLNPVELPQHADRFGHFALEFDFENVRQLGAIPVFYIPQREGGVGTSLLAMLLDARAIVDRAAIMQEILSGKKEVGERIDITIGFTRNPQDKKTFSIHRDESKMLLDALNHQTTPWPMLKVGMDALLNFFYPADNTHHDEPLQYYQQREWRIACSFAIDGVETMRRPTADEISRIVEIDGEFFRRPIMTDHGPVEPLGRALVLPGLNGKSIIQMTRRLFIPDAAVKETGELLKGIPDAPEILPISALA